MKIGLVLDDSLDKTDGVQQYVLQVGSWLVDQGHEVHYLVGQTSRIDLEHLHSLSRNVNVRFNGNRLSIPLPASSKRIKQLLQAEQFDVLHVQMPYSPLLAGKIIRSAGPQTAVVATFHILPYSRLVALATSLLALWSRPSVRRIDQILSVSPAAAEFALSSYHRTSLVVPNTFDYYRFAQAKALSQYSDRTINILFLGRLVARKGCQTLLEAITLLPNTLQQSFRVIICGGGPLQKQLASFVKQHDLNDTVTFVGRVSEADKPRYYASADIAVFPSSGGESFGIVLLEAMANGRTSVLGGDNPGYRSVLQQRPEQLFKATDAQQLADTLTQLINNRALRVAAAHWGQKTAQRYDAAVVGKQLIDIYADVIAKNSSSRS